MWGLENMWHLMGRLKPLPSEVIFLGLTQKPPSVVGLPSAATNLNLRHALALKSDCGVAALAKGQAIGGGLRLAL
jgi:hypothetical protein